VCRCLAWTGLVQSIIRALVVVGLLAATSVVALAQTGPIRVEVPAGGDYLVWALGTTEDGQVALPPVSFSGTSASYDLGTKPPSELKEWGINVLDRRTGLVAFKTLPSKGDTAAPAKEAGAAPAKESAAAPGPESAAAPAVPTLKFEAKDFDRVNRLQVQMTGEGGKPLANATVTVQDSAGKTRVAMLEPSAAGSVAFENIRLGSAKVTVTPKTGGSITKEIEVAAPIGGGVTSVPVALPDVTDVVATPATATPATTAPAAAPAPPEPAAAPAAPVEAPRPAPAGPSGFINTLFSLVILGGALYGAYYMAKQRGWTIERVLAQLGVQPIAEGPLPRGNVSAPPPAAPVDPNVCPFCGQRKDPVTGQCACSVDAAPAQPFATAPTGRGEGPRLIATQGAHMGQIYPLTSEALIGRDPGNAIPLTQDTAVSRRHARIVAENGGYLIHDEGSSNGTFVNGRQVTDSPLRPGDEVSVGGTRFRFEV
jgi:FHA domain